MDGNPRVYHLTTRVEWDSATQSGTYRTSTHGMSIDDVGFIHASQEWQLAGTATRFYRDVDEDLVVLTLDVRSLEDAGIPVRYEDGGNGDVFPHLYAPVPCSLVESVRAASFDEFGMFVLSV